MRAEHRFSPQGEPGAPAATQRMLFKTWVSQRRPAVPLLRVGGVEATTAQLGVLLSEIGVSAECTVELLAPPPICAAACPLPDGGSFEVYAVAPSLGTEERVCVELSADATVGALAAAAAQQLGIAPRAYLQSELEGAPAPPDVVRRVSLPHESPKQEKSGCCCCS
eukprot:TRINITY_DN51275_c0_g1_i1.p1 TRINITY_DN51275_c0_g1~~TRINITY_DN51275_c0_g1_i1.p1  ORF type:complete len:192 (+),score=45.90 TRINITY_DN51275_c0_g1_i1:81-578(+)